MEHARNQAANASDKLRKTVLPFRDQHGIRLEIVPWLFHQPLRGQQKEQFERANLNHTPGGTLATLSSA